ILNPPPNPPPNFLPTPSQPPPTSPPAPFPLPPPYQYLAAAEAAGHKVGANAVSALVEALAAAGRTEAALAAFHRGRAQGVQPLPYAVGTMIMALGRAGKVEEMMALFRESRRGARGARRVQGCFQKGDRWTRGSGGEGEDGGDGGKGEGGEGGRQWEGVTWQQEMRSGHALVVQTLACLVQLHDVQCILEVAEEIKDDPQLNRQQIFDQVLLPVARGLPDERGVCLIGVREALRMFQALRTVRSPRLPVYHSVPRRWQTVCPPGNALGPGGMMRGEERGKGRVGAHSAERCHLTAGLQVAG
ncbi:unnamed protein product, partial [Closterium sp. NIES-53]